MKLIYFIKFCLSSKTNNFVPRFIGSYELVRPAVIVRDIELIKKITIKDFEYFIDHRGIADDKKEPLFGRNLFALKGNMKIIL